MESFPDDQGAPPHWIPGGGYGGRRTKNLPPGAFIVAVRALRKEKGLSQEVLSGLAGIARTHLTMIENGTMKATVDTICKIAQALDLRPSELFAMVEERQDKNK